MPDTSLLSLRGRILSLGCGALYLAILTPFYAQLTGFPLPLASLIVLAGAGTIIAVIAIFCAKWVTNDGQARQLKLSTLFLPFIPISIYLALHSQVLQALRHVESEIPPRAWWTIQFFFVLLVVVTTVVLLTFGEAVIWLALAWRRRSTKK